jgi:hypothetical protein
MPSTTSLRLAATLAAVALWGAGAAAQVPGAVRRPAGPAADAGAGADDAGGPRRAGRRPPVGRAQAGIVLEVTELRRMTDKGVMQLKFAVSNSTEYDTSLKELGLAYGGQLKDISVIDFAGKKQYDFGSAGGCLCSTFSDNSGGMVAAGQSREFWAWYALPQGSNKRMALRIPDQQPIMDIPLQ